LPLPVLALVVSAIVFAPLSSWLALQRGRSWAAWFAFGVALGPIAVGLLLAAPPGRCPNCGTRTQGWPRRCQGCGIDFRQGPAVRQDADREGSTTTAVPGPARAISRRAALAGRADEPGRRSATALGRRATLETAPATSGGSRGTVAILGSAIFMGGNVSLQIGSRYILAKVGAKMHILGPVDLSPSAVAARISLADAEATVVADRLLITGRDGAGLTLAFSGVAAEPGVDLEQQLVARTKRRAVAT